jgi:uridine phosphorylase
MVNSVYQKVAKNILKKARKLFSFNRKEFKEVHDQFDDQNQLAFHSFRVTVNYDQSVEELIREGNYDRTSDLAGINFLSNEKGVATIRVCLVKLNRAISSEDVIEELSLLGLRAATLKELLALGTTQPDLQRSNTIVALGSTWRDHGGDLAVAYLSSLYSSRDIYTLTWDVDWDSGWQFAAVQK